MIIAFQEWPKGLYQELVKKILYKRFMEIFLTYRLTTSMKLSLILFNHNGIYWVLHKLQLNQNRHALFTLKGVYDITLSEL